MPGLDYPRYLASRKWALKRAAVRERSDDTCERCLVAPMQAVHHLTYTRIGNELMSDLLGVCNPCHAWLSAKTQDDTVPDLLQDVQRQLTPYEAFAEDHAGCLGLCIYSTVEEYARYYGVCHDPRQRPSDAEWDRVKHLVAHFERMLRL